MAFACDVTAGLLRKRLPSLLGLQKLVISQSVLDRKFNTSATKYFSTMDQLLLVMIIFTMCHPEI